MNRFYTFFISFFLLLVLSENTFSKSYYSKVGQSDANSFLSWTDSANGNGASPSNFTTASNTFIVQFGHSMTTTVAWTVSGLNSAIIVNGGSLTLANNTIAQQVIITSGDLNVNAGVTLTINNGNGAGADLDVQDILNNSGTILYGSSATGTVSNSGKYNHKSNGGNIPLFTWSSASTFTLSGVVSTLPSGLNQNFGNFIYNCTSQTASVSLNTPVPTFQSSFTINSTNTGSLILGASISPSVNLTVNSGTFDLSTYTANGGSTFTLGSGAKLRIGGTNNFPTFGTYNLNANSNVEYYGSTVQTIAAKQYGNLFITGARVANITLANSDTIHIAGQFSSTVTFAGGGYITSGSTVNYNGTGSQIISRGRYGNLCISGNRGLNNIIFDPIDTIHISGTFSPLASFSTGSYVTSASTLDFNGTGVQTIPAFKYENLSVSGSNRGGIVSLANTGIIGIAGMFSPTATFSSGGYSVAGSTVDFNGYSSQLLPVFKFNNLIISNTATNTSTSSMYKNLSVDSILTIRGMGLNVQYNDTITAGKVIVESTGWLELLIGSTLIVNNGNIGGVDLVVDGTISNRGKIIYNSGGTGQINGTYEHSQDGGTIPMFTWANGSLCNVTGMYNVKSLGGLNQNFYDFRYNCPGQMDTVNFNSQLKHVVGMFDFQAGKAILFNSDTTLNVGNFSQSGGTLNISSTNNTIDTIRINNAYGNFSQLSPATTMLSGTGAIGIVHFVNTDQQGLTLGTISGLIGYRVSKYLHVAGITSNAPFIVDSGAMLYVEGGATIAGSGSFFLNNGTTMEIKDINGIANSGYTGAIQVTGLRTFSNGAKYIYKGNTAQQTGNGLPSSVSMLLIDNAAGVMLNNALTVDDSLWIYQGELNTGSNLLNVRGILKMGLGSSIAGNAPMYNSGSTLVYVSGGIFNRGLEWSNTSGAGYPYHVDIRNNTILNLGYGGTGISRQTASDLYIASGSELKMDISGSEMTAPLIVNGDLNNAGTLTLSSQTGGGFVIGGHWNNSGLFYPNNRKVTFNGSAQNIIGATTFDSLTIDNGTVVTLNNDIHVSQELNFVNGRIATGSNAVIVTSSNDVVRTNGYVVGNLKKYIPYGNNISKTFEIGDANYYTPVNISFARVDTSGYLTVSSAVSGQSLAGSKLNTSKKVNRYWKLTNSGIGYNTYDATFNFNGADVDGGANANNFIVARHDGTNWSLPSAGLKSATSTQMTGQSGFGEFAIGELSTFPIMTMPYGGGLITPMGITNVPYGNTLSMAITPNAGNLVDSVKVDGMKVDSTTSYTFINVTAPHTINVYFSIQDITPPNAPQNLIVTKGDGVLQLHWNPNSESDFSQYYFYYGTAPNPVLNIDSTTGGINDTLKTVYGLTNYLTYYIRISAVDIHGNVSTYSNEVSIMPVDLTPPLFVQYPVAVGGDGEVQLHWNPNTETDFSKYYIYGGLTSSPTTRIDSAVLGINDTIRTITGLVNNTLYYFRMTTVDTSGNESNYSIDIFATPVDLTAPAPPQNLVATAGDQYVLIHWNPSNATDFKKYYVYRGSSPNPTSIIDSLSNVNDTVKFYGGLTNYQQYFFRVTALDSNQNMSVSSNEASAMPLDSSAPATPNLASAIAGNLQVTVTWNKNLDGDFKLYRIYYDNGSPAITLRDSIGIVTDTVKIISNLFNGSMYSFRVVAVDSNGNASGFSNELSAVPIGDSVYTRVVFSYGYQPNGTTDLITGVMSKQGVLYSKKNNPSLNMFRTGFNFANDSVGSVTADFYFYSDPPYVNNIFANNGIGGIYDYGFTTLNCITIAPTFPTGYSTNGGEVELGKSYVIVTRDGLKYAKIQIIKIDTISVVGKPATPFAFSISGGDRQITTFWNANEEYDVVKYRIYSGFSPIAMTLTDSTMGRTDTTKVITGLTNNVLKYYRISAVDIDGNESSVSDIGVGFPTDVSAPNAPQNLLTTAGDGQVTIHWNPNSEIDFQKYYIYLGNTSNTEVLFDSTLSISDTIKTYTGLTNYQQYYFRVIASDIDGNGSAFSNEVMAMPIDLTSPASPTNLVVIDSAANYFTIAWNMNAEGDIAKYYIYRDTVSNPITLVDSTVNVVDTVRVYTSLVIGKKYYFKVAAVDINLNISSRSNEVSAAPYMIYGIHATAFGNGTISPVGSSYINHGDSITYLINASAHHHIDKIIVDSSMTLGIPSVADDLKMNVKKVNGKNISKNSIVSQPKRIMTMPIVINGNGNDDTVKTYSFINVIEGHTINAYFSINSYTISSSVVGNGTIVAAGNSTAYYGDTISYNILPDFSNHIDSVLVDGKKVDSTSTYTFFNVTSDHSIEAYFSPNRLHHFNIENVSGGVIPSQIAGQYFLIRTTAVDSLENPVADFIGNVWFSSSDTTMGLAGGNYSIPFTAGHHGPQIVALYNAGSHTISVIDSVSGKTGVSCPFVVSPSGLDYFAVTDTSGLDIPQQMQGYPFPIKIIAVDAYNNIQSDYVGSVDVSVSNGATLVQGGGATPNFNNGILNAHLMDINSAGYYSINVNDPIAERNGTSNFFMVVPNSYTISSFAMNGIITPNGNTNVNHGDTITYNFAPNFRYHIDSVFVDGLKINDSTLQYTFINITSPHSIFIFSSANLNMAPVFTSIPPDTAIARFDTLHFQYNAFDPDSGKFSYSLLNSPSGASIDSTGLLKFIPAANANGIHSVIVQVIDDSSAVVIDTVKIRVNIYGDVSGNGMITSFDASLVLQNVISAISFTPLQKRIGDVTGNNDISSLDASYLLQYSVGLISSFPGGLGKNQKTEAILSAFSFRIEKSNEANQYNLTVAVNQPSQVLALNMVLGYDSTLVVPQSFSKTAMTDSMLMVSKFFADQVNVAMAGVNPINKAGDVITFTFTLKDPNYPKNALLFTMKKFILNETDYTNDIGGITLNVRDLAQLPTVYKLEQNFPNPFNPTTTINYQLPDVSSVKIIIYNMLGQEVKTLISEQQTTGYYSIMWNGMDNANRKISSGVYIYRIVAIGPQNKRFSEVKKMVLIR